MKHLQATQKPNSDSQGGNDVAAKMLRMVMLESPVVQQYDVHQLNEVDDAEKKRMALKKIHCRPIFLFVARQLSDPLIGDDLRTTPYVVQMLVSHPALIEVMSGLPTAIELGDDGRIVAKRRRVVPNPFATNDVHSSSPIAHTALELQVVEAKSEQRYNLRPR